MSEKAKERVYCHQKRQSRVSEHETKDWWPSTTDDAAEMIATLERHASKQERQKMRGNAKQCETMQKRGECCKERKEERKKERKKFVRLRDRGTSVHSDDPTFPSVIKHPLNLTNSLVDHFSVELVRGVCTGTCWLLPVSKSAAQVHLRPEEYACTSDVTGR